MNIITRWAYFVLLFFICSFTYSPLSHGAVSKSFTVTHEYSNVLSASEPLHWQLKYQPAVNLSHITIAVSSDPSIDIVSSQHDANRQLITLTINTNNTRLAPDVSQVNVIITGQDGKQGKEESQRFTLWLSQFNGTIYSNHVDAIYAQHSAHIAQYNSVEMPESLLQARATESSSDHQDLKPTHYLKATQDFITRSHKPSAQRSVSRNAINVTVSGKVQWKDADGGLHPLPAAKVEVLHDPSSGDDVVLATTTTQADGTYTVPAVYDNNSELPNIFVKISAVSTIARVLPATSGAKAYFAKSATQAGVADGTNMTVNLDIDNSTTAGQSFSIHHALVVAGTYIAQLNGNAPALIDVKFPSNGSHFNGDIHLLAGDKWDWDVIHHEYGHYIMDAYNFEQNPGGSHSFSQNLSEVHGKGKGLRLAWGEGWPTFFGTAAQHALNTSSLNIPKVGDLNYDDTEDATISYSLETTTGTGEDNEQSVSTVLWDLYDDKNDGESTQYSGVDLFKLAKSNSVFYISQFWDALVSGKSYEEKSRAGKTFGLNKIAPVISAPANASELAEGLTFSWTPNGGGPTHKLDEFTLKFFDVDLSIVLKTITVSGATSYTLTADDVNSFNTDATYIKWIVEGSNSKDPVTPSTTDYWSHYGTLGAKSSVVFVIDDTGSMREEIGAVVSGLQAYLDLLESNSATSTQSMHLISFKDNVNHRLTTSVIDEMRGAVAGLFASGGGDCPEASGAALAEAANIVKPGGTIFIATDAANNSSINVGSLITQLQNDGVTVHTLLSGDCDDSSRSKDWTQTTVPVLQRDIPEGGTDVIDEPGEALILDMIGDSIETATPAIDMDPLVGEINDADDDDVFKITLQGDTQYYIRFGHSDDIYDYPFLRVQILTQEAERIDISLTDGTVDDRLFSSSYTPYEEGTFSVETSGDYYVKVYGYADEYVAPYYVQLKDAADAVVIDNSAKVLFSVISAETGGAFENIAEVNEGDDAQYSNTIFNILRSTEEPSIVATNVREIPRDSQLDITLTGKETNWSSSTSVTLTDSDGEAIAGVNINKVQVISATSIVINVSVANDANLQDLNVNTQTTLGDTVQSADGVGILTVTEVDTRAQLLSVTPKYLGQGNTIEVTVQGINTEFTSDSSVDLGVGIEVQNVTAISSQQLMVTIAVSETATAGLRGIVVDDLSLTDGFVVTLDKVITAIQGITPHELHRRLVTDITIAGFGTGFEADKTEIFAGDDVVFTNIRVNSETELVATISIGDDAELGYRDLSVSTPDGSVTKLNGIFIDAPPMVEVPDVTGLNTEQASTELSEVGLALGNTTNANSDTIAAGSIISQSVAAGTSIVFGDSVDIVVSDGTMMITVPSVTGMTQSEATSQLEQANLVVGTITQASSDSVTSGSVISQSVSANSQVVANTTVNLVVSTGPAATPQTTTTPSSSGGGGGGGSLPLWSLLLIIGLLYRRNVCSSK